MASSLDRVVVVAAAAASVAARMRETEEDEAAEVDVTLGPAGAGAEWWSEDMMIATAAKTTNRDASATVVTMARLRRLRRWRARKAGCTRARGRVVLLACSHRASGHDIDTEVPSQFGIGRGGSGTGAQTGSGADTALGSDAGPVANRTTASTFE